MTHAAQYVLAHGALVLFIWILVQQAGLPVPGATLLLSIGALSSSGRADFAALLAAAFGGCLVADGFWYQVGRLGSSKHHRVPPLTGNWRGRVLGFITRHAAGALVPAKFISASSVASLLAGRAGVPAVQFLVFDSIASLAWAASCVALGYLLRSQVQWTVAHALRPSLVLLTATAVWPLAVLLSRKFKGSLRAAVLPLATILSCAMPVASQYGAGLRGASGYAMSQSSVAVRAGDPAGSVAKQNVELANETLARSRDRFTSGVSERVEAVQAEQALASANDQYITSIHYHNLANSSLARALGVARTSYQQYLGGK